MIAGTHGTVRNVIAAALRVTRLATMATPLICTAWARKGPATAPVRVAAASAVRNTALTRPSIALGITRCIAVSGITWHIEPNMPIPTAAGSAVVSDDELNSKKNAAAVTVRLAVSRVLGWVRSRTARRTGAPMKAAGPPKG
jgi:hypothetical protein